MLQVPVQAPLRAPAADSAPKTHPASGHRNFLDGVRALAALWVVISHLWIIPFGMNAHDGWLGRLTNWTLYSHFAVDVFLVVSGFCLVLPVTRSGGLEGGAWTFFRRRARRILPPFYAALGLSVAAMLGIQRLEHHALSVSTPALLANALLAQDLLPDWNVVNGPFWSIAVEWRIYWVFPLLVWLLLRGGRRRVLAAAALAGGMITLALLRWRHDMLLASPWFLLLFAAGLCAGSLSAQPPRRGERAWCERVGLISLATAAALVHAHPITLGGGKDFGDWLPVIDAVVGVGAAAGLLWVSRSPRRLPLLSIKPLAGLGSWSYSIYLIHMPCLLLLDALVTAYGPAQWDPLHHVFVLALLLPLVLGAARLFFLAFERPFLSRPKRQLSTPRQLTAHEN